MADRDYYSHTARSVASTSATPYDTPRSTADYSDAGAVERHRGGGGEVVRASDYKPALSLLKQEILSEDDYVQHLSDIIKRDFFPALRTLDAQHDILDAYESEDPHRIEESVRKMREICTPTPRRRNRGATPGRTPFADSPSDTPTYFGSTPSIHSSTAPTPRSKRKAAAVDPSAPAVDPNISLDAFQARYTSEDNSSFAQLLARDNAQRKERHAWAWEAERRAKTRAIRGREARERLVDVTRQMIEQSSDGSVRMLEGVAGRPAEQRLIVEGVEGVRIGDGNRLLVDGKRENQLLITSGRGRADDSVMGPPKVPDTGKGRDPAEKQFVDWDKPTADELEDNKAPKLDDMQVQMEGWDFTNRNSFMFPPDADITHQSEIPGAGVAEPGKTADGLPAGEPKGIRYHATRLGEMDRPAGRDDDSEPSPSRSRIGAAIAGTPYPASSASRTPKVSGFSFVDALPTPQAASLPASALQELMTWGTIEATPVTLRSSGNLDASTGPFKIKDTSRRENLAHEMAKKAKRSLADRASDGRGPKGLATTPMGLRKRVLGDSVRGSPRASSSTRGGPSAPGSPRASSGDLSPAATALLSRTKPGRALSRGLGQTEAYSRSEAEQERKRQLARARAKEVEHRDRMRRQRWSESPALSMGIDADDREGVSKRTGPSEC